MMSLQAVASHTSSWALASESCGITQEGWDRLVAAGIAHFAAATCQQQACRLAYLLPTQSLPLVPPARYLLLSIGEGCEPANRVYIVDLTALDKGADGSPHYAAYEFYSGAKQLPIMKLIDNFEVGCRAAGWVAG